MTKVKVKVCPNSGTREVVNESPKRDFNSVVMDINEVDGDGEENSRTGCVGGVRRICYTKYAAECHTERVEHEMEEDRPNCKVRRVKSCSGEGDCRMVPAVRCKIEKKMVKKMKPETRCQRVPRQFCRKEMCDGGNVRDDDCYYRTQVVS